MANNGGNNNPDVFAQLQEAARKSSEEDSGLRILAAFCHRRGSPGLRQIDTMLINAARRMVREQAAKEAMNGTNLLTQALNRSRSTGEPPRLDDLELARELSNRASCAYSVLGELSEDALYDNVANQWNNIADEIQRLITSCLNERARAFEAASLAGEVQIEPMDADSTREESSEQLEGLIDETDRITSIATAAARAVIRHPIAASLLAG